jgi:molybdopterin-binding protein
MQLSARNQIKGTVEDIQLGEIMARVLVRVGENVIESVITREHRMELPCGHTTGKKSRQQVKFQPLASSHAPAEQHQP